MSKSLKLAAAILGGLGIGLAIVALLIDRYSTLCPICGGKLCTDKGSIICTSCGTRLRTEEVQPTGTPI